MCSMAETEETSPENIYFKSMKSMPVYLQIILSTIAFVLSALGQPLWPWWIGAAAAAFGYALLFSVILAHESKMQKFLIGSVWFTAVQLVQLWWFTSHPYLYIWGVYLGLALWVGIEFGVMCLLITPARIKSWGGILSITSLWVLFEWSRLFVLSGLSWNPIGMNLAGNIYSLQFASVAGIYGLTFWVMLTNLLALRAWIGTSYWKTWAIAAILPYLFGIATFQLHDLWKNDTRDEKPLTALLIQTAFPPEEDKGMSFDELVRHVTAEWKQILTITKNHPTKEADLIVLPEFVVPFGTYSFVYPAHDVLQAFHNILGPESLQALPDLTLPYAVYERKKEGLHLLVNNAYILQGLSNFYQSSLLAGLEDAEDKENSCREYYSAAIHFQPNLENPERYSKRVLVPMAEYIPFKFCENIASRYGIFASFTHGKQAEIFICNGKQLSPSICYEETFSHIMRDGKTKGAELFVNLTSDVWYPNSSLPRQHLEHARLRSVENGIPLIRACNTGITAAIDCFGQDIAVLGDKHPEKVEWEPGALLTPVPTHTHTTLYALLGDGFIVGLSIIFLFYNLRKK